MKTISKILFVPALAVLSLGCTPRARYKDLSSEEFASAIKDTTVQLVDVRTPEEFDLFHIKGAINVDVKDEAFLDSALAKISKDRPVAIYCRGGVRSVKAATLLSRKGYKDVLNLHGGVTSWREDGYQVTDINDYIVFEDDPAPDFEIEQYIPSREYPEGYWGKEGTYSLSSLRGKVVMLQFTASWCSVCRKEMPHIESEIFQRWGSREDFVLLGIDRDESWEKMDSFIRTTGITYPLCFDPGASIYDKFASHDSGITRNVLVDRDGRIVFRTRLFEEEQFEALVGKIEELLERKEIQ